VPLAATTGSAVIAVSDPSEDRMQTVRELTGPSTRFVVLTERTLDALLRSRMFAGATSGETAAAAPAEPPAQHSPDPRRRRRAAGHRRPGRVAARFRPARPRRGAAGLQPAGDSDTNDCAHARGPSQNGVDGELVDAIVAALGPRLQSLASHAGAVRTPSEPVGDSIMDPVARVDAAIEAWSSLRAALETIGQELDASRQSLREAKGSSRSSTPRTTSSMVRIDALEAEVAERKTLVDEARFASRCGEGARGERHLDDLL
jgi:hypothetical protein